MQKVQFADKPVHSAQAYTQSYIHYIYYQHIQREQYVLCLSNHYLAQAETQRQPL